MAKILTQNKKDRKSEKRMVKKKKWEKRERVHEFESNQSN